MVNSACDRKPTSNIALATLQFAPRPQPFQLPSLDLSRYKAENLSPGHIAAARLKSPTLDNPQGQASSYWPGSSTAVPQAQTAAYSQPAQQQQQQNTLPTPPTDSTDSMFKPPPPAGTFQVSTDRAPHMATALDSGSTAGSLTARRPAATNLGSMSLPPLPFRQTTPQKPIAFFDPLSQQPLQPNRFSSMVNSGNLLTPPTTLSGDNLSPPVSSGLMADNSLPHGLPQASPASAWLPAQQPASSLSASLNLPGTTPPSWTQGGKGFFSPPGVGSLTRTNTDSPNNGSNGLPLPHPAQATASVPDFNAMPFPQSQVVAPVGNNPLVSAPQPTFSPTSLQPQSTQQSTDNTAALASPPALGGTTGLFDRSGSTPGQFGYSISQPSSAQSNTFPFHNASSPLNQSPLSAPLAGSARFSPSSLGQLAGSFSSTNSASQFGFPNRFPTFPIGSQDQNLVNGPVMTNIGQPGSQMSLVGLPQHLPAYQPGYHSGHAASMYGQQQSHNNDRPFKCDQCPQSFNRNHDLKRHKRIHLAVKPYPCGWCDKSFSRKDALKVSINSWAQTSVPPSSITC